jgi:anti-sigma regulatory factor (Ser/Thr protein kinase)
MDATAVRMFEALPLPAFVIDAKSRAATRFNAAARACFAVPESLAGAEAWLELVAADEIARVRTQWNTARAAGAPFETAIRFAGDALEPAVRSVRIVPLDEPPERAQRWFATIGAPVVVDAFQHAALPMSMPLIPDVVFDASYEPGEDDALVGGDWYDAVRLADGRIVLSVGDVAGSGLASAVLMTSIRQIVRGIAQIYADPLAMIDAADRTLKIEHPGSMVTAFVAVFDPIDRKLTYASAGHPPALLRCEDGTVTELGGGDLPLGLRSRSSQPSATTHLPDGSLLVFYTDGLVEATRDIVRGLSRLQDALASYDVPNPQNAAHELRDLVLDHRPHDDAVVFTMFVQRGRASAASASVDSHLVRWTFDCSDAQSARSARLAFVEALRSGGARESDLFPAELVFGELIGNVVRHAPGGIEIVLDWTSVGAPVLHVLDRGAGFLMLPRLPSDVLSERGRGLFLVWTMTDEFNVTPRSDGGSHARAVLRVHGSDHRGSAFGEALVGTALYPFEQSG